MQKGPVIRVSPYKLSIFQRCPLRYKFQYIDFLGEKYKKEWPHFIFGRAIHKSLADFFRVPPEGRTLEGLKHLLRQHWLRQDRRVFKSAEEERMWGEKALEVLEIYYRSEDMGVRPEVIEERLEVPVADFILLGRIDRVDRLPDGGYELIDYKTGTYVPPQEEFDQDLQMSIYCLGLYHQRAIFASKLTAHYLQAGEKLTTARSREELEAAVEKIREIIAQVEGTEQFKPRVSPFCSWCDYLEICPAREEAELMAASEVEDLPF